MTRRHIWHKGEWVDVTDWKRAPRVGPYIIRDTCDPLQHPITGETFDSKSAFRAVTRAHGAVELGNDAPTEPPKRQAPDSKADVIQAYQMVRDGYTAPPIEVAADAGFTPDATRVYPTP
jgi:hypothetical protein